MFDSRYQAVLADTEESKNIHYHLRYKIYCLEKGFESSSKFKDEMERDQYDENSVHFIVRDKITNEWLATVRLVRGETHRLPIQKVAKFSIEGHGIGADEVAELSRLSILRPFRHQAGKRGLDNKSINEPEILIGLIRAAREYSRQKGIKHWLFLCRRSIMRVVGNVGMKMHEIGPACEHRGARYPYLAKLESAFDDIIRYSPRTHEMFSRKAVYYKYSELFDKREHNSTHDRSQVIQYKRIHAVAMRRSCSST